MTKKKPKKHGLLVVLDGELSIQEYKKGKRVSKEVVDGMIVLEIVQLALRNYLATYSKGEK